MRARIINGMLAFWLFLSAFMWPHSRFELQISWLVALTVMFLAMAAITGVSWARFATAGLGACLAAAALLDLGTSASRLIPIHNIIVGLGLCAFGLMRDVGHWYADSVSEPGPSTVGFTAGDEIVLHPRAT